MAFIGGGRGDSCRADDDGGADQEDEAGGDQHLGARARSLPLLEEDTPEGGEMMMEAMSRVQRGEVLDPHLGFGHGVEEELEYERPRRGRLEVVGDEGVGRERS